MFGEELVDASRTARSVNDLAGKRVAIYFSASWCGPCRAFTPRLIEAYQAWQEADEAVEVVLVSLDRSAADMRQYMRQARMPWLAVPHGSEQADALRERFQVRGIPMLVVVDAEGRTLSTSGRGEVGQQGAAALDRWKAASP